MLLYVPRHDHISCQHHFNISDLQNKVSVVADKTWSSVNTCNMHFTRNRYVKNLFLFKEQRRQINWRMNSLRHEWLRSWPRRGCLKWHVFPLLILFVSKLLINASQKSYSIWFQQLLFFNKCKHNIETYVKYTLYIMFLRYFIYFTGINLYYLWFLSLCRPCFH